MKTINTNLRILALWLTLLFVGWSLAGDECTIGAAAGKATSDGRPMIWKTRDNSGEPDNELVYNTSYSIPFLEVVNAGKTYAWMGVNKAGFAILNSVANDLPAGSSGYGNGSLMRKALGTCASVAEFQSLLDETNISGRKTRGNFAVLDSSGAAAIFEVSGDSYWKFDANDTLQSPAGYLIRTNFAENGTLSGGGGYERYKRSKKLIHDFYSGDSLNYRSIIRFQMRDFSDFDSNPVPVPFPDRWLDTRPYGYIYTNVSICRYSSVSAAVIQGILPGESEKLTTMWTILGSPAASVAVPYWSVGSTPPEANGSTTAPLCDISLKIRSELFDYPESKYYIDSYKLLDGEGGGIWTDLFPAEDSIFTAGESWLQKWRQDAPDIQEMLTVEKNYAQFAYQTLQKTYDKLTTDIPVFENSEPVTRFELQQNYPNPFNSETVIPFYLPQYGYVVAEIFNSLGQKIETLASHYLSAGRHKLRWNTNRNLNLSSGLYYCRFEVTMGNEKIIQVQKLMYLK
ncbi:MAG: hypothetical protein GXO77_17390 [Calditrichaeota bacterium]|nr:hypothetical protein [Calditrichota bacterium]